MRASNFDMPFENFRNEFVDQLDQKIVVVSVFGKSSLLNFGFKKSIVSDLFSYHFNHVKEHLKLHDEALCNIEGQYDDKERVLYLNLRGSFDTVTLIHVFKNFSTELKNEGFLPVWSRLKHHYARAVMFLFSVSHIIILVHPSYCLDLSYIHLLKALCFIRSKYQGLIATLLRNVEGHNEEWAQHGRLCSPRALFYFTRCPESIAQEEGDEKYRRIKKLEHALEDQIYQTLRKIRLVKNICDRACFSIAPNDEFVYVCCEEEPLDDYTGKLLTSLIDDCKIGESSDNEAADWEPDNFQKGFDETFEGFGPNPFAILGFGIDDIPDHPGDIKDINDELAVLTFPEEQDVDFGYLTQTCSPPRADESFDDDEEDGEEKPAWTSSRHLFQDFLMNHIRVAHGRGFFDNMGKYTLTKSHFELPTLSEWFLGANKILLEPDIGLKSPISGPTLYLEKLLNMELRFSSTRCSKVLPLALVAYLENLPPHYTAKFHKEKVDHAISVFTRQARGPEMRKFIEQLKEECEKHWKSGRQMCEILSLTRNPCSKPMHSSSLQPTQSGENEHWSGVRYMSSCNCGVTQGPRPDPFTIRAANFDFYQSVGKDCVCAHLERKNFPIFQPSIHNFRAAELLNVYSGSNLRNSCNDLRVSTGSIQTLSIAKLWGPGNSALGIHGATTPHSHLTDNLHLVLNSDHENHQERPLVRQASTTEYLPSMLHTESPMGLLPQFPSWSLICRGPSSLYSHNVGLQDQPNFMSGSGYLLPWDVTIRQKERCWPTVSEISRRNQNIGRGGNRKYRGPRGNNIKFSSLTLPTYIRPEASADLFSVKIFVGVEYECLRGHRFMSSGPGKVLRASGSGLVKENATKVTKGNMPLYLPCPCCSKGISQLMRIHIVTPKAPVFVTINPRVRPAPAPCPIFVTGAQKPTPLSQSAYWVLRLPYIYAGERETYHAPEDPSQINYGELLGPMYGITEVPKQ